MSLHAHQFEVASQISSNRTVATFIVAVGGTISSTFFLSDNPAHLGVAFDIKVNGSSIYASVPARATFNDGDTTVSQSSLNFAVTRGDTVTVVSHISASFATVGQKLYGQIEVEDGKPTNFGGTSTSSNTVGTGSKTFATQANLAYGVGSRVRIAESSAPTTVWLEGVVTSYSGTSMVVSIDATLGSGTHTDWSLTLAGQPGAAGAAGSAGATGATGPTGPTGPSGTVHSVVAGSNVTVDSTDPANPIVSSTGGGGGGGSLGIFCPDIAYATPSIYDDEFNTGSLDAKWTAINTLTPTWAIPNHIGILPADSTKLFGFMQTAPAGDSTWVAKFSYEGANGEQYGIGVRDSGTYWLTCAINGNAGSLYKDMWLSSAAVWQSYPLSLVLSPDKQRSAYLKLVYTDATKKVKFYVSTDGISWWDSAINETTLGGTAIDRVAIVAYGSNLGKVHFDFFRKLQGAYIGGNI